MNCHVNEIICSKFANIFIESDKWCRCVVDTDIIAPARLCTPNDFGPSHFCALSIFTVVSCCNVKEQKQGLVVFVCFFPPHIPCRSNFQPCLHQYREVLDFHLHPWCILLLKSPWINMTYIWKESLPFSSCTSISIMHRLLLPCSTSYLFNLSSFLHHVPVPAEEMPSASPCFLLLLTVMHKLAWGHPAQKWEL